MLRIVLANPLLGPSRGAVAGDRNEAVSNALWYLIAGWPAPHLSVTELVAETAAATTVFVIDLEVVPQGNLAERIRAAGARIGAFFCPTGVGTPLAHGKETRTIDGRDYVLEYPIRGDVALIGATLPTGRETCCTARPHGTSDQ